MKRLAYKTQSWLETVKRTSCFKKASTDPTVMDENVSLLNGQNQRFRVDGPDGAWSWVVAFANFLVNFIIVGLGRMSGLLFVVFMQIFNIDRKTAAIPFSIQQVGSNLFDPAVGIIGQKYGIRAVAILGGLIGSVSAALIFFKMDIISVTFLWGLFFGISTALTTTLNQVSIDQHFEKYKAAAGGFALSGGYFGAFIFPLVIECLIDRYTVRGTFLVLGAIILFVVPAAIMIVEPTWKQGNNFYQSNSQYGAVDGGELFKSQDNIEQIKANNRLAQMRDAKSSAAGIDFKTLLANSDMVFQFLTIENFDKAVGSKENQTATLKFDKQRLLSELECVYTSVANPEQKLLMSSSDSISFYPELEGGKHGPRIHFRNYNSEDTINESNDSSGLLDYDAPRRVYIQNKLKELYEARGSHLVTHFTYFDQARAWKILIELRKLYEVLSEQPFLHTVYNATYNLPTSKSKNKRLKKNQDVQSHPNAFCSHIKTAIKLHGNPLFLLICLCRGVFMLTFIPVVTIIVDFAMDKGLPQSDGKYIIAVLSLGDLIGRLCLGWVTDRGCLSLQKYMLVGMVLLGGSTASLPLTNSNPSFMAAVLFFGILQGSLFVRHPLLVTQYMENHEKSIGMGLINLFSGLLGFALPSFIGFFRDTLGSYNKMFYLNGIICAVVGMMWILEPLFQKKSSASAVMSEKTTFPQSSALK